jgi:hypothetical protein
MTCSAIHRVEASPVSAIRTDVTVLAFRRSVRRTPEEGQIYFVAIVTGVLLLGLDHLQREQQD